MVGGGEAKGGSYLHFHHHGEEGETAAPGAVAPVERDHHPEKFVRIRNEVEMV